jgi:hypothetical protein
MLGKRLLFLVIVVLLIALATGISFALADNGPESGESGQFGGQVDGTNPEPFDNPITGPSGTAEEIELDLTLNAPDSPNAIFFKRYAGSIFQPMASGTTYEDGGAGCTYRTGGELWFTADLQLPDGAEIDFLRVYFYDIDPDDDIKADIYSFDGAGNFVDIIEVSSSGAPGWDDAGSGFFSYIVDNIDESLAFVVGLGDTGPDLMFCGLQVRYQYATFSLMNLPAMLNGAQP